MHSSSTLSEPFYMTRPTNLPVHLPSVQIMSVDILPTSIPSDASAHFSHVLKDYLKTVVQEYRGAGSDASPAHVEALKRATIARDGRLLGKHKWLKEPVTKWRVEAEAAKEAAQSELALEKKKVLMLGSGMVAGPAVDEIARRRDVELLVG